MKPAVCMIARPSPQDRKCKAQSVTAADAEKFDALAPSVQDSSPVKLKQLHFRA